FSSRRRHTRLQGDWSSNVCSSDLAAYVGNHGVDIPATFNLNAATVANSGKLAGPSSSSLELTGLPTMSTASMWDTAPPITPCRRSEERRVGKEGSYGWVRCMWRKK